MAYLDANPPAVPQFRRPRREEPSGVVVVHTAENTPDFVAPDGGAEAVARFIAHRTDYGSYHDLADSDTTIQLVEYDCEAFHDATGSNRHSYGLSIATRADRWPTATQAWRDGAIHQAAAAAARYAHWLHRRRGIVIPARRINRAESEMRVPGFISHAERDPARRHDPGQAFPWDQFLATFERLTADLRPATTPDPSPQEDIDMLMVQSNQTGAVLLFSGGNTMLIINNAEREAHEAAGIKRLLVSHAQFLHYESLRNDLDADG